MLRRPTSFGPFFVIATDMLGVALGRANQRLVDQCLPDQQPTPYLDSTMPSWKQSKLRPKLVPMQAASLRADSIEVVRTSQVAANCIEDPYMSHESKGACRADCPKPIKYRPPTECSFQLLEIEGYRAERDRSDRNQSRVASSILVLTKLIAHAPGRID